MRNWWMRRLMDAAGGDGGAGGGGDAGVAYDFGKGADGNALPAETITELTTHAKELGLTAEQAPKFAAHYLKSATSQAEALKAYAPPEQYKFAQVDGKDLAPELTKELSETAKALGLTAEQAQKFADYELGLRKAAGESDANALKAIETKQNEWRGISAKDPEVGGDKYEANKGLSKTALEKFFPDVAKNAAGFPFLDHPEVFKGLVAIGKAMASDGDFVRGGAPKPSDAKSFYANSNMNP